MTRSEVPVAGEGLLNPAALAAIATLFINDHYLKQTVPSWLTGKLSDIAGLVFFPLFLQALCEALFALSQRRWAPSRSTLVDCIFATALVFSAVKLLEPAAELYRYGLGAIQSCTRFTLTAEWQFKTVQLVRDASDLIALPALWVAWRIGRRRSARFSGTAGRLWGRCLRPGSPSA